MSNYIEVNENFFIDVSEIMKVEYFNGVTRITYKKGQGWTDVEDRDKGIYNRLVKGLKG